MNSITKPLNIFVDGVRLAGPTSGLLTFKVSIGRFSHNFSDLDFSVSAASLIKQNLSFPLEVKDETVASFVVYRGSEVVAFCDFLVKPKLSHRLFPQTIGLTPQGWVSFFAKIEGIRLFERKELGRKVKLRFRGRECQAEPLGSTESSLILPNNIIDFKSQNKDRGNSSAIDFEREPCPSGRTRQSNGHWLTHYCSKDMKLIDKEEYQSSELEKRMSLKKLEGASISENEQEVRISDSKVETSVAKNREFLESLTNKTEVIEESHTQTSDFDKVEIKEKVSNSRKNESKFDQIEKHMDRESNQVNTELEDNEDHVKIFQIEKGVKERQTENNCEDVHNPINRSVENEKKSENKPAEISEQEGSKLEEKSQELRDLDQIREKQARKTRRDLQELEESEISELQKALTENAELREANRELEKKIETLEMALVSHKNLREEVLDLRIESIAAGENRLRIARLLHEVAELKRINSINASSKLHHTHSRGVVPKSEMKSNLKVFFRPLGLHRPPLSQKERTDLQFSGEESQSSINKTGYHLQNRIVHSQTDRTSFSQPEKTDLRCPMIKMASHQPKQIELSDSKTKDPLHTIPPTIETIDQACSQKNERFPFSLRNSE